MTIQEDIREGLLQHKLERITLANYLDKEEARRILLEGIDSDFKYLHSKGVVIQTRQLYLKEDVTIRLCEFEPLIEEVSK